MNNVGALFASASQAPKEAAREARTFLEWMVQQIIEHPLIFSACFFMLVLGLTLVVHGWPSFMRSRPKD
jgi:hypothetical protein